MKHNQRSASPGELAYSIDDPPRQVSTPENNSTEGVYLTIARNTQPGARIGCGAPLLSDHRTQEAKQTEKYDSTVLYFSDNPPAHPATSPRDMDFLFSNTYKEPDFLRDFEIFYFRFNSRSATENRTEKKLRF